MRSLILTFILLFTFGCSDTSQNNEEVSHKPFTIRLAPSLAPNHNTNIPVNSILLLDVSTTLDPSSITDTTVYIQDVHGNHHPSDISLVSTQNQIVIQPKVYLSGSSAFEIVVTTQVITTAGEHLTQNSRTSFVTGVAIDTTAPTLVGTLPQDGEIDMERFGIIYFQFSEPLSPLIDSNLIRMYDTLNDINITGTIKRSDRHLSFTPESNLSYGVPYRVELNTSSITDMSSNNFSGQAIETIDFNVTTTVPLDWIKTYKETTKMFNTSNTVNCIYDNNWTLYIGHENGLSIVTFDVNDTNFTASSFNFNSQLTALEIGSVYDINFNLTTKRAYLATSKGIYIVDINDRSNIFVVTSYLTTDDNTTVPIYGINLVGDNLYLAATTLGLIDLNISDEQNITVIFNRNTNGIAFDVILNAAGNIIVSNYDQNFTFYTSDGTQLPPSTSNKTGTTHNISTYTDSYGSATEMVAGGISGLVYIDEYYNISNNNYITPSYVSQVRITPMSFGVGKGFGIIKSLGIVGFTPYDQSTSGQIDNYQLLPYDVTAIHSKYDELPNAYTVLFASDENGSIHAYKVP